MLGQEREVNMKRKLFIIAIFLMGMSLLGWRSAENIIKGKSISDKKEIFVELQTEDLPPKDFSDLLIKAQIKTHLKGHYFWESKGSRRGDPTYPFLFNIDGQAITWDVDGEKENTPFTDKNGLEIPDGGEGMRYSLVKRIRLHAGHHTVFFAHPGDNYYMEFEIILEAGKQNMLELKPIYRGFRSSKENHLFGIKRYEVFINGVSI
jgi:hypothetical protein